MGRYANKGHELMKFMRRNSKLIIIAATVALGVASGGLSAKRHYYDHGKNRSSGLVGVERCMSEKKASDRQLKVKYTYEGKVTRVHDGDTVWVKDDKRNRHKIRMAYIDAPETNQRFGKESKDNLYKKAIDQRAEVVVYSVDNYNREVAKVVVKGEDLNLSQLQDGLAWHYCYHAATDQPWEDYNKYQSSFKAAQDNKVGLWKDKNPTAPWDFRKNDRKNH